MIQFGKRIRDEAARLRGYAVRRDTRENKFYLIELKTNHVLPQRFDTEEEAHNYFTLHIGGE